MEVLNDYVTISEACKVLGIKESNIRKHIAANRFKKGVDCKKLGSTWVFKKEAIKRKYSNFPITLEERQGKYNKENYSTMIEPEDIGKNSSLLGFIPADEDLENCPRLVLDDCAILVMFRGYYITNLIDMPSGRKVIYNRVSSEGVKSILEFKNITELINYILVGSGLSERYFTNKELEIIKLWVDESIKMYCEYPWDDLKEMEIGPAID